MQVADQPAEQGRAQLYNVINSITISNENTLAGSPQLGDLRFSQPDTGWYWVVTTRLGASISGNAEIGN